MNFSIDGTSYGEHLRYLGILCVSIVIVSFMCLVPRRFKHNHGLTMALEGKSVRLLLMFDMKSVFEKSHLQVIGIPSVTRRLSNRRTGLSFRSFPRLSEILI